MEKKIGMIIKLDPKKLAVPGPDQWFVGCGYGGPGKPVPYFQPNLESAKVYHQYSRAESAAERYGGAIYMAELDEDGWPRRVIGPVSLVKPEGG